MYIKKSDLYNFADDNTFSCISSLLNELISELVKEPNIGRQWFAGNSMNVNPDRFQAIIIDRKNQTIFHKSLRQMKK